MGRMKKLLVAGAVAGVVILIAAWFLLDANRYKGQVQTRLQEQLRREVSLGNMRLGLLPLRFSVENLSIAEDSRFQSTAPFTQAEKLDVLVSFSDLLRGNVVIDSIELVGPKVELIRDEKGVWNFSSLASETTPPPAADAPGESGAPKTFTLKRLAVTGGSVAITDRMRGKPRAAYAPIDITLLDYSAGKPFSFDVAAHLPNGAAQTIQIKGTGGPLPESGPAAMPLKATISLSAIDVAGLRDFLDVEAVPSAQGSLSGETLVESQAGKLSASGQMKLDNARIGPVDLGYPVVLDYAVSSEVEKGLVDIASATLRLGPTPITLSGSLNTIPDPMTADLRLKAGEATITEVARLASAFGVAFSPDTTVAGRISGDIHATGPVDKLALSGTVSGRDLKISGKDVPQPVQVGVLDLALTPTEIRSNDFVAKAGQTTVNGKFALRQYATPKPTVDATLSAPGATLSEIQAIARAYGLTGLDQLQGAGKLNFNLRAAGPLDSVASANVMRAVNGTVNLDFNTLKILGFDTTRQLATIGGFLKSADPEKGYTDVLKLAGRIVVKNGVAETNDLVVEMPGATIAATGSSDLAASTLNLRTTAIFSKEFSDKVGGTKIGGFLSTALANDKGEIVIPAIISGSTASPKFSPDSRAFLQLQKNRLGLNNPRQALTNVLNALGGKKAAEEPADPNKPAEPKPNPLRGLLEGVLGGKK